jgi:DNA-binding NarL/FixJ family response regulator
MMLPSNEALRVLIIDKQPVARFGLMRLLNDAPSMKVVGDAGDMKEFERLVDETRPDVLLVDPAENEGTGVDSLRRMCGRLADCRIIIYTTCIDQALIMTAIELGVSGYLLKDSSLEGLLQDIHRVCAGNAVLAPAITSKLVEHLNKQSQTQEKTANRLLSDREFEVLACLAQGKRNRTIASSLYVCEATVKFHVRGILEKLNAANRTEAVMIAVQRGMVRLCIAAFYAGMWSNEVEFLVS